MSTSNSTHQVSNTTMPLIRTITQMSSTPPQYIELIQTFSGGYIFLSYMIAVVGSLCTLELLLRRTSNRGTHNGLLLVAAGICFGSVSTFSMHFIGNNSLSLHHPDEALYDFPALTLAYAAGWTVLSLVVSCGCMIGAFFVMGLEVGWGGWVGALFRFGRRGGKDEEDGSDLTGREEDVMDLSEYALKKDLTKSSSGGSKKTKEIKKLKIRAEFGNLVDRLEHALRWTMIDFNPDGSGESRSERRRRELQEERAKNKAIDWERTEGPDTEIEGEGKDVKIIRVKTEPSDPVASGYDNEVLEGDDILPSPEAERPKQPEIDFKRDTYTGSRDRRRSIPTIRNKNTFSQPPLAQGIHTHTPTMGSTIFNPAFSFPGPSLSPTDTYNDTPITPSSTGLSLYPPPPSGSISARRASLPLNSSGHTEPMLLAGQKLDRIQSLPEPEPEDLRSKPLFDTANRNQRETAARIEEGIRRASVASAFGQQNGFDIQGDTSTTNLYRSTEGAELSERQELTESMGVSEDRRQGMLHRARRRRRSYDLASGSRLDRLKSLLGYDTVTSREIIKILVAGTICGWGIAGMHYLGQQSIVSIPYIAYSAGNVVGSVIIACAAVIVALYIMFIILRPKLQHGWLTRIAVACILAGAVCTMHYTAMGGTKYALLRGVRPVDSAFGNSKKMISGIVASLAILACFCILTFIVISQIRGIAHRKGRRRVVVTTMIYDQDDRLLVSPDGILPMCDIASVDTPQRKAIFSRSKDPKSWDSESTSSSVLDLDLTASHPAFIAALRSTWAWRQPGVVPARCNSATKSSETERVGSSYRDSTQISNSGHSSSPEPSAVSRRISTLSMAESACYPGTLDGQAPMTQNVGKFLDRFSTAVAQLANIVTGSNQGVRRLGVLYDRILTTGHVSVQHNGIKPTTISKGQLIFLVRRVTTSHEKSQLLARNFLFAEPNAVATVMSKTLAVPVQNFLDIIDDQRDFCDEGMFRNHRPGRLYASACIVQPTTRDGIQLCVDRKRRHQLPSQELCTLSSSHSSTVTQSTANQADQSLWTIEEMGEAVLALEGQTLFEMLAPKNELLSLSDVPVDEPNVTRLRQMLVDSLIPMLDSMLSAQAMVQVLPRLVISPQIIPLNAPFISAQPATRFHASRPAEVNGATSIAWTIVFKAVLPVDAEPGGVDWEPWSLFRAQQECVLRDGREGLIAARNALIHASQNPASVVGYSTARRPSKIQWSTGLEDGLGLPFSHPLAAEPVTSKPMLPKLDVLLTERRPSILESPSQPNRLRETRRASVAPSQMDEDYEEMPRYPSGLFPGSNTVLMGTGQREAVPGVNTWRADWMTRLLKEDLYEYRARTNEVWDREKV